MILWVFIKIFGVKIVITDFYRYLPIFYRYFFKNSCTSASAPQSRFFGGKIGDFTDFPPIFPLIDFSSDFSSRCRPKIDFSAKYRPKKPIFCFLLLVFRPIDRLMVLPLNGVAHQVARVIRRALNGAT